MLGPSNDGEAFDQQRRAGRRDARRDRILRRLTQGLDVRHIVKTQHAFALPELLVEHCRTDHVLFGVRVQTSQPGKSGRGRAGSLHLA